MAEESNRPESGTEFHEAMPATAEYFSQTERGDSGAPADEGRFFAIVTLALVALVVVALGLLFLRGLDVIRSNSPVQQPVQQPAPQYDSSGTLEL
jgi:hypothetical protein